jgi:thimet oligopeptidase
MSRSRRRENRTPPDAPTLGELPFDLAPAELRSRSLGLLGAAEQELDSLVAATDPATVDGFLAPLDAILARVRDIGYQGSLLFAVHPTSEGRAAGKDVALAADRFFHRFRLHERIYELLRSVDLPSDAPGTRFALAKMLREMRRAGVEQPSEARTELLALNERIDRLCHRFEENIANLDRAIELDSESELAGLPADFRASHRPNGDGRIRLTTKYPDFLPTMAYADRAEVRRRLLLAFANRAYPENIPVLAELLAERRAYATRLGYPTFAAYAIEDKMMETPAAVEQFLLRLSGVLSDAGRSDLDRYLTRKRRDVPGAARLEPWEAQFFGPGYYDQKIRNEEFGVDMRQLRRFLPYGGVRDALFALCGELLGLEFTRSADKAWHPTVEVYDVRRSGAPLGRVYLDMVPRDGKYNHAACFGVREGLEHRSLPQCALVCNFVPPGQPAESARMEYNEVVTFFHEFGHLLHTLLSGHQRWLYNGMSHIEWDFVEAPSQLFEEWARDPATLARFARDPDTGEAIPAELVQRLRASASLGRALGWVRQVALAAIALELYSHDPAGRDLPDDARRIADKFALTPMPPEYHFVASFGHLTGYSAFYYTYAWSAVIARDLLTPFYERGSLTDPAQARRYAEEILAPGSERPARELVRAYLGREFSFDAFERWATESARLPSPGEPPSAGTVQRAS